jgi:hypothetical protein
VFRQNTVFIVGAGASWHYGYPTGEVLVSEVIRAADAFAQFFDACGKRGSTSYPVLVWKGPAGNTVQEIRARWDNARTDCERLSKRLRAANPLVIDYFLGHNPTLQTIGKFLICWVIMAREEAHLRGGNPNRTIEQDGANDRESFRIKDDWCRFVTAKLMQGCAEAANLVENRVNFVTFNYDMSLENALYEGLLANDRFEEQTVLDFLADRRVIHCYGKIRKTPKPRVISHRLERKHFFQQLDDERLEDDRRILMDEVLKASELLGTIDPEDKSDRPEIEQARKVINDAKIVYILGYGFDENNSDRLNLDLGLNTSRDQAIVFTNYQDSNRVNKRAGRIFAGDHHAFLPPRTPWQRLGRGVGYVEKSVRNVDDALALDFDELENDLIPF